MKHILPYFILAFSFNACTRNNAPLVGKAYADSLVNNYNVSGVIAANAGELNFWKDRIDPLKPGISNELKYARTLISRFHLSGDINDIKKAEAVLRSIDSTYKSKEASVYTSLTETALLQHQFKEANEQLGKAKQLGIENYISNSLSFDVAFESGDFNSAMFHLNKMKSPVDYGYHFRKAKLFHLQGKPDSATAYMLKAAALVPENSVLHDIALSNAADFYIHTNNNEQAAALFKKCVAQNRNDVHSIMALGTIAMKNDHDHASAEKLFKLANKYYQLPDPLFKLYQLGQQRKDKNMEKKFAEQFASVARNAVYGKMYTKYFIELYTGILNQPELAEKIAAEELTNRSTPQTAAWYAWTLFNNKKTIEAEKVYKESVAGKPLEGLELFYMGKLMTGLKRTRTAHAFFKAAEENKFDLSPRMTDELKKLL